MAFEDLPFKEIQKTRQFCGKGRLSFVNNASVFCALLIDISLRMYSSSAEESPLQILLEN